jgi:hypothetical protein
MKKYFLYGAIAIVIAISFPLFFVLTRVPSSVRASTTNISATTSQHWAWNDEIGWIDFYSHGDVNLTPTKLAGSASSSVGLISMDCATSPNGNICNAGNGNYYVANNGNGNLSGWAWNDDIGWISFFWGNASANPSSTLSSTCLSYGGYCGVSVSGGVFSGWAWNDDIGWIDFNCSNTTGTCGNSQFDVVTTWVPQAATGTLDSQIFDTGVASGAQLNSVTWKGSLNGLPASAVGFQFAVSNSTSGPWNFTGTSYVGLPASPILLGYSLNGRYFRYRVTLTTDAAQLTTPRIDDVIVNWSP